MTTGETTGHKQSTLRITGMTCAACANRIERGLSKLEGVAEANVNLALEKATVSYDPAKISVERIEQTIEKLGYGTVKATAELLLEGMTCAACANRIEKGLNKLPGVREAAVNFALETAHVVYSPAEVSLADIQQKVKQLGYQARPKEDAEQEDHRQKEIQKQKRRFILSALLSLPLLWSMVGHFSFTSWIYMPELFMNPWFQLVLATPVQFIIGRHFYVGAYKALRNGSANMDVLSLWARRRLISTVCI